MYVWLNLVLLISLLLGINGCKENPFIPKVKSLLLWFLSPWTVTDCWYPAPDAPLKFQVQKILADQGNAEAQYKLGDFYYIGNGVKRNTTLSVLYSKMAADQGLAKAQRRVGECYIYGTGVSIDKNIALHYFQLAGDQGDETSQFLYEYNGGNSTRYGYMERNRKYREALQNMKENSTVSTGSVTNGSVVTGSVTTGGLRSSSISRTSPKSLDSIVHGYTIVFAIVIVIVFVRLMWYCLRRYGTKL